MKKLQLGKAEVTFTHQYHTDMQWSEKKGEAIEVKKPVATTVTITVDGTSVTSKSSCSKLDHFNFEKGRKVALARAVQAHAGLQKSDRTRIWTDYNKLKPGGRW